MWDLPCGRADMSANVTACARCQALYTILSYGNIHCTLQSFLCGREGMARTYAGTHLRGHQMILSGQAGRTSSFVHPNERKECKAVSLPAGGR